MTLAKWGVAKRVQEIRGGGASRATEPAESLEGTTDRPPPPEPQPIAA